MKLRSTKEINSLPREILVLIFSFLHHSEVCNAAMVCKLWKDVARTKSLWTAVTISNEEDGNKKRLSPLTRALFRRYIGYSLECLFIHTIDNMFLKHLWRACPNLHVLVLNGQDYRHCDFRLLPSTLRLLEISICDPDFDDHYPPDWYESFNDTHFPFLLSLKFTQAPHCSEALMQIATLDLNDLYIGWVDYPVTEESFDKLMTMSDLEELALVAVEQIPEDYAHKIVKNLRELRALDFLHCEQLVTCLDICTLAKLPNLETLKVPSKRRIMKGVIRSLPEMEKLKEVRFDTDIDFAEIPGPLDLLDILTTLQKLRPDVDFYFRDIKVCEEKYDYIQNKSCVGEPEIDSDDSDFYASDDGNYDDDSDDDFDDDDSDDISSDDNDGNDRQDNDQNGNGNIGD